MALAEVGFCGVVVWLGECILGRSGENEVVGWVRLEQRRIWVRWRWIWVELRCQVVLFR